MAKNKLTTREYIRAFVRVGYTSFRIAPSEAIIRLIDSLVQSILPIVTAYFAALTTTALVGAYSGNQQDARDVFTYLIITVLLGLSSLIWNNISNYITTKTRYKIQATIEDQMILHFMALPFWMYDDKDVIDLHDKAKRFSYFFSYIFNTIASMLTSILSAISAIVALTILSPVIGIIVLLAVMPGIYIQLRLARQQAQHWEGNITNRRKQGNMSWMIQDSRYIAEMRIYGVAKHLVKLHAKLRDTDEKARLELELKSSWKQLGANVLQEVVEFGALVWIAIEIINRSQPVGQFVYVQQIVRRAVGEASSLANQLGRIDEDLANIVDYQKFMELTEVSVDKANLNSVPKQLVFQNVSFQYPKTKNTVLKDISLTLDAGKHVAIVGENGAGKSTLIKLMVGLYEPTKGDILLDKARIQRIKPEQWHKHIALLGQDYLNYYFANIRENIEMGDISKPFSYSEMKNALSYAEFASVVDKLEKGPETYIERWMADNNDEITATELSGGQYQRLALARNFYRDSPIVILDEPTSAIDALAEEKIFKKLFDSNKTIIAISHRLSTVKRADEIYVMKNGEIVESGPYSELSQPGTEFHTMFKSQM